MELLVHNNTNDSYQVAKFGKSIFKLFGFSTTKLCQVTIISLRFLPQHVVQISQEKKNLQDEIMVPFGNATLCPLLLYNEALLPAETAAKKVALAVCVVLVQKDSVLLTRRAKHMRTFPSCFVFPGGGVELTDESLYHTAQREIKEEVGMDVNIQDLKPLCCWESCFPVHWDNEQMVPKRHHFIVYFVAQVGTEQVVKLQQEEVDSMAWIDKSMVQCLNDEQDAPFSLINNKQETVPCSIKELGQTITTGTRFALQQWFDQK